MSSSTSSSEAAYAPPSRAVYVKILLAITVGMAVAMAIIRLFTFLNDVSGDTILGRVLEARAALPQILAEEKDLVMFYGSSMVQAGFSARQFDRQMAERGVEVKAFNFGFGGLNPYFQDYLARRIREAFEAGDRRLELAMLEFNPFQTTTARWQGALPVVDSFVVMLASPNELWEITRREPARGIRMLNIHYLRDDISAEMITWHFGGSLRPPRPRSNLPEDEEISKRLDELGPEFGKRLEEDYPDYADEDWYYPWQGAGTIPEERSESTREVYREYYELLRNQRFLENDELNRITCCDIEELHFKETLIAAYIRIVQTFQQFSDRVEVILLPRNTAWIEYSQEAAERLQGVLDRIRDETGVVIKDWQVTDRITPEMFSDTTHLSRYAGDVEFTEMLVEEYAPLLAGRGDG